MTRSEARRPEVVLVVRDKAGALERVFGTMRRRRMALQTISMARFGEDLVIVLRSEASSVPDRWLAELEGLWDVRDVRVTSFSTIHSNEGEIR